MVVLISPQNTRTFHRTLFAGMLETVTILKRNDNQQQGTVRTLIAHQCRRSKIAKAGQSIQGDMSTDHNTIWHIPITEMERLGINYFNVLDRIVDGKGRYWQPERGQTIESKLFENHTDIFCVRVDPPA